MATTPITTNAIKSIYAELNRQKDLKWTYRKKYKDLQAVVTTAEHNIALQQPAVVANTKGKANPQVLKVTPYGKGKGPAGKGKDVMPLRKGKKNVANPPSLRS